MAFVIYHLLIGVQLTVSSPIIAREPGVLATPTPSAVVVSLPVFNPNENFQFDTSERCERVFDWSSWNTEGVTFETPSSYNSTLANITFRVSNFTLEKDVIIPYDDSKLNSSSQQAQGFITPVDYIFHGFSIYISGEALTTEAVVVIEPTTLNMTIREDSPGGPILGQTLVTLPTVEQWFEIAFDTPFFLPAGHYYVQAAEGDEGRSAWMHTSAGSTEGDCYIYSGNWQPQLWNLTLQIHVKNVIAPESVAMMIENDVTSQKVANISTSLGWANVTMPINGLSSIQFSISNSSPIEYSYSAHLVVFRLSKAFIAVTPNAAYANWSLKAFTKDGPAWSNYKNYQANLTGLQTDYYDIQAFSATNIEVTYSMSDTSSTTLTETSESTVTKTSVLTFTSVVDTITFKSPNKITSFEIPDEIYSGQYVGLKISLSMPGYVVLNLSSGTSNVYENTTYASGIVSYNGYVPTDLPAGLYTLKVIFFKNNEVGFVEKNLTLLRVARIETTNLSVFALDTLHLNFNLSDIYSGSSIDGANVNYMFKDLAGNLQMDFTGNYTGIIDLEQYAIQPGSYALAVQATKEGYKSLVAEIPVEIICREVDLEVLPFAATLHPGDTLPFSLILKDKITGKILLRPAVVIIKIYPTGKPSLEAIVNTTKVSATSLDFSDLIIPAGTAVGKYDILIQINCDFYTGSITLAEGVVIEPSFRWDFAALILIAICSIGVIIFVQRARSQSRRSLESDKLQRGKVFSNIIFYKFDKRGPTVIHTELPLEEPLGTSSAAYFYTTIGQGSQYRTGLFGPIPFGWQDTGEVAMIYATGITDTGLLEPRLAQKNYFLVALITTPEKVPAIDRVHLEKQLERLIQDIPDLATLKIDHLIEIAAAIHSVF